MLSGFQERPGSWSTTVNRATSCNNVNMPPEDSSAGLQALLVAGLRECSLPYTYPVPRLRLFKEASVVRDPPGHLLTTSQNKSINKQFFV